MTYRVLLHRSDESFPVSGFWVSPDAQSREGYSICTVNPGSGLSPRQMSNFLWGYSKVTNVGNILQSGCCEARHVSLNLFTSLSVFSVGVLQKTKLFTPVLKIRSVALKSRRKPWKLKQIECRWKYRCFIYIYAKEYLCDYFEPDSTETFAAGSTEIEANIFTFCLLLFKQISSVTCTSVRTFHLCRTVTAPPFPCSWTNFAFSEPFKMVGIDVAYGVYPVFYNLQNWELLLLCFRSWLKS